LFSDHHRHINILYLFTPKYSLKNTLLRGKA
jgi:hypothetical protein